MRARLPGSSRPSTALRRRAGFLFRRLAATAPAASLGWSVVVDDFDELVPLSATSSDSISTPRCSRPSLERRLKTAEASVAGGQPVRPRRQTSSGSRLAAAAIGGTPRPSAPKSMRISCPASISSVATISRYGLRVSRPLVVARSGEGRSWMHADVLSFLIFFRPIFDYC